jgi:hypothetical protein
MLFSLSNDRMLCQTESYAAVGRAQPQEACLLCNAACEHSANISRSTRVHARVTPPCRIPSVRGAFVAVLTRPCPRLPRLSQDGKEGVDGSSPSEGLAEFPANWLRVLSMQ